MAARMYWGAVIAGAALTGAVLVWLGFLGRAVRVTGISQNGLFQLPVGTVSGYGPGMVLWLAVSAMVAFGLGGYVAARLSGPGWTGLVHALCAFGVTLLAFHLTGNDQVWFGRPGGIARPFPGMGNGIIPGTVFNTAGTLWLSFLTLTLGFFSSAGAAFLATRAARAGSSAELGGGDSLRRPAA